MAIDSRRTVRFDGLACRIGDASSFRGSPATAGFLLFGHAFKACRPQQTFTSHRVELNIDHQRIELLRKSSALLTINPTPALPT